MAGTLGLKRVQQQALQAEQALTGQGQASTALEAALEQIDSELAVLLGTVQRWPSAGVPAAGSRGDGSALKGGLLSLQALLRSDDLAAVEDFAAPRPQLAARFPDRLRALDQAVDRVEFNSALSAVEEMLDELGNTPA